MKIIFDPGDGVEYEYSLHEIAEHLIREFAADSASVITMMERPPEIRRNRPARFRLEHEQERRTQPGPCFGPECDHVSHV